MLLLNLKILDSSFFTTFKLRKKFKKQKKKSLYNLHKHNMANTFFFLKPIYVYPLYIQMRGHLYNIFPHSLKYSHPISNLSVRPSRWFGIMQLFIYSFISSIFGIRMYTHINQNIYHSFNFTQVLFERYNAINVLYKYVCTTQTFIHITPPENALFLFGKWMLQMRQTSGKTLQWKMLNT